jgi:membrane-associated protease RseP (regulator of RpoE activity)
MHIDFNGPDFYLVLLIAAIVILLATFVHESGHYLVAKLFGVNTAKLVIFPGRRNPHKKGLIAFVKRYAAAAAIDVPDEQLLALELWKRRLIFLAGCVFDVLAAWIVWVLLARIGTSGVFAQGVMLGFIGRVVVGVPLNLIPIPGVQNDGWLLMNPNLSTASIWSKT